MRFFLFIFSALFVTAAQAAEGTFTCPDEIKTAQSIAALMTGWESAEEKQYPSVLESVSLYDGPPKDMADLEPDNGDSNDVNLVWTFGGASKNIWLRCNYAHTRLTLAKLLPDGFTTCTAERDANVNVSGQAAFTQLVCK